MTYSPNALVLRTEAGKTSEPCEDYEPYKCMVMEIKKTERADLTKVKGTSLLIGFVISLSVMFVALEWTQKETDDSDLCLNAGLSIFDQEMIIL